MQATPLALARRAATIGVVLMTIYYLGGDGSPEPDDHPAWKHELVETTAGRVLWIIVSLACLPAFVVRAVFPGGFSVIVAFFVQGAVYFGATYGIARGVFLMMNYIRRGPMS